MSRLSTLLALIGIGFIVSACGYNTIPTLQEQAKARWSDVQNQYQRRADLIPNLVATVQGYAAQEKNVLTAVVEARAKATQITVNASDLTDPEKLKAFQDAQAGSLGIGNLPHHGPDDRIQARAISTARQDADLVHDRRPPSAAG